MNMKPWLILAVTLLGAGLIHAQVKPDQTVPPALAPQLKMFFAGKRV